jgi:hypothetical protein
MKTCKLCDKTKPLGDMGISNVGRNTGKIWYKNVCKICDAHLTKTTTYLRKITPKPSADHVCNICEMSYDTYHLDHDWKTDEFRGWLCTGCNTALGRFNDDVNMLKKAANYLMRTGSNSGKSWGND